MERNGRLAALCVLACCQAAFAQDQPQLVWEGVVDGTSVLSVRGNRVQIDDREGLPVQRQRHRFFDRLPDSRQNVRMEVREGRGRVRILEQPRAENNYVLSVSIEDRQGGSSFYSLEFFWDTERGGFFSPEPARGNSNPDGDRLTWSGRVDDEAVVECRGSECRAAVPRGNPVTRERFRFSRPLPNREATVSLDEYDGRGEVLLLEQPRRENGYTARVRIRDPKGGASDYSFTLSWTRGARAGSADAIARRGMVWSGRVDGRVRVSLERNRAWSEVVRGAPVENERADFFRDLPRRDNDAATVRRVRGRGRVELVEYPSRRNGYKLVFEIDDGSGGAADYEIEAGW